MNQDTYTIIRERNEFLSALFKAMGIFDRIKMVGDIEKPAFIWDGEKNLSMHIKNYHLIFKDKPFGNEVHRVKLSYKTHLDTDWFNEWVSNSIHGDTFKIAIKVTNGCPPLFLSGFNYVDKENKLGKYPVFSHQDPRVFFSKENAINTIMAHDNYPLFIQ